MRAAVVDDFTKAPRYGEFADPAPGPGEEIVEVHAAALSPLVRGQASGKHYSSATTLPTIPGVDGAGRLRDGRRVYFAFPRAPYGSMAERTVVPVSLCVELPDDLDDVSAAALANPGMSSWAALTERAKLVSGESVLINGATGTSGRLAIGIAKHLGAGRVIATGRNRASIADLPSLGADAVIALDQSPEALTEAFRQQVRAAGVVVILDYLWGTSAERLLEALSGDGSAESEPRIRYVQIGAISGPSITLPGATLRSSGLELLGSGLGSVSQKGLIRAIGGLMKAIVPAGLAIETEPVPLADVAEAWGAKTSRRIVFTL